MQVVAMVLIVVIVMILLLSLRNMGKEEGYVFYDVSGRAVETGEETARSAKTDKEKHLVQAVQKKSSQFVQHLKRNYGKDPRARKLINQWKGEVIIYERAAASYNKRTGRMFINPTLPVNYVASRLNSKILHELAHSNGTGHDEVWRRAWHFFLRIATRELGWKCQINRVEACKKYSLCHNDQCPRCVWS
jgi:hypothetical protein